MTSLREIQAGFAAAIRDPHAAVRFAQQVCAGDLAPPRRLQLYHNNHYTTLIEALAAVYPVVLRLVGELFFRQTARQYAGSHASRFGDIHAYGEGFGDFLDQLHQAVEYPYLGDVARLEWAYHAVFHSERRPALDLEGLQSLDPGEHPRLHFDFQPAARLLESRYPVLRIWQANQDGWAGDECIRLDAGDDRLLIMREAIEVVFLPLGPGEQRFLAGLVEGETLADALVAAQDLEPGIDPGATLSRHVALGTLVGWRL